jgi:putative membrane protein
MRSGLLHFVRGYFMGAADVVPGVSGGTVALVFGIYRRLVHNIRTGARVLASVVRLDLRRAVAAVREVEWSFLIPLLLGILTAVLSLARLIETLLETRPVEIAAVFFGLVAASIVVAWRLVRERTPRRMALLAAVAVSAWFLLGLRSGAVADPALWAVFGAGAVAICAMILPGISGSFILLMIGMYEAVLAAVNDRDVLTVAVFLTGAVVGLASFSALLDHLLSTRHDTVMAALVGLMAGSLRVLWPWPDGTDTTALAGPRGDWWVPVLLAVAGVAAVLGLTAVVENRARRSGAVSARVD